MGLIYAKLSKSNGDRFIYVKSLLLTQETPLLACPLCASGRPPVSQWLGHFGPVCQLVDICLLPSSISRHGCNPPTPHRPVISTLLWCFPRHQLGTTQAHAAAHLAQLRPASERDTLLLWVCGYEDLETFCLNMQK